MRSGGYRVFRAFLGGYSYGGSYGALPGPSGTPTSILDSLYDRIVSEKTRGYGYDYYTTSMARALAQHPNSSTETIVKLSCAYPDPEVNKAALLALGRRG